MTQIIFKDEALEIKLNIRSVKQVIILPNTLLIKFTSKRTYIISPNVSDTEKLIAYFESHNITVDIELD